MGRLVAEPDTRYTTGSEPIAVGRYRLAVDRRYKREGQQSADYINCVVFGKSAEATAQYLHKGSKICIDGHIQTGSYKDRDGKTVYTTDIVVDNWEFAESKRESESKDEFMTIPDGLEDELPFS